MLASRVATHTVFYSFGKKSREAAHRLRFVGVLHTLTKLCDFLEHMAAQFYSNLSTNSFVFLCGHGKANNQKESMNFKWFASVLCQLLSLHISSAYRLAFTLPEKTIN